MLKRRLRYGYKSLVLSVETLEISSVQELSLSLYFRSFHRQNNKNPASHLMHSLHCKFQSPGCSTTGIFGTTDSPAVSHLQPAPPDHSSSVKGSVLPPKDAFHLRSLPRAGPVEEASAQMQSCATALQDFAGKCGGCFVKWWGGTQGTRAAPVPPKSGPEGVMSAP